LYTGVAQLIERSIFDTPFQNHFSPKPILQLMKRLSMLLMLVALISVSAFAQTSRHDGVRLMKKMGVAKPSLLGSADRIEDCDTFVNLCNEDTLVAYYATCDGIHLGGYITGHNCYGDNAKADIFYLQAKPLKVVSFILHMRPQLTRKTLFL
jgi:hypothetical protein